MSSPTRSTQSHARFGNESSHEETGEHRYHANSSSSVSEPAPYQSLSPGSENKMVGDSEASLFIRTWVQENYVAVRDHNVPRKDMYEHYRVSCIAAGMEPVNSATFGKLLRSVFPDLKTRRLGVRGQSKYHYCGIRLRSGESEIVLTSEPSTSSTALVSTTTTTNESYTRPHLICDQQQPSTSSTSTASCNSRSLHLPSLSIPIITSYGYSPNIDYTIAEFTAYYENHCRELLKLVVTGRIEEQQQCLKTFYVDMPQQYRELIETVPEVCDSMWRWDCTLFDTIIIETLPDIPYIISPEMMRALQKYTQELFDDLKTILVNYPNLLYRKKLDVARIFTCKFRRQLSLNQNAQTVASILSNPSHLEVMRSDWNTIDIDNIIDQIVWMRDHNPTFINQMLRDTVHKLIFATPNITYWMRWTTVMIDNCLKDQVPTSANESEGYLVYSTSIIAKWNFYTSMVIKDLVLRDARSLSYFLSLKVFLDDYIMYLVEENIAHVNHALVKSANELSLPSEAFFGPSTSRSKEEDSPA
ncbi:hypothetical protein K501DRAFT_252029 [Backusella circina FSU 941]|nr:hypothetical protein K501DRAFT_252029 [Backusella circina FSU 941]